jgi:hypothetical protein
MSSAFKLGRGQAMMVTLIALTVLMLIVMAAIRFTGTTREAAVSKLRGDKISACAEAARAYVLSRFQMFGVQATDGTLVAHGSTPIEAVVPSTGVTADQMRMMTGHVGSTTAGLTIAGVAASSVASTSSDVRDLANAAPSSRTFGQTYNVVVKCQEPIPPGAGSDYVPRESEVEFQFRFGGL